MEQKDNKSLNKIIIIHKNERYEEEEGFFFGEGVDILFILKKNCLM